MFVAGRTLPQTPLHVDAGHHLNDAQADTWLGGGQAVSQ
jgi:hypothetical protein